MRTRTPLQAGLIDAVAFSALWSVVFLCFIQRGIEIPLSVWFGPLGASCVVAWRGATVARKFAANSATVLQTAIDGAKAGFVTAMGWFLASASYEAQAAGGYYADVDAWSLEFLHRVAEMSVGVYLPAALGAALFGAIHGVGFHFLNRKLLGVP